MSFSSKLSEVLLPKNGNFKFAHIQSRPIYVKSPIHLRKSVVKPDTVKIRHFFTLILDDLILVGIEIFVYIQIYEDHVVRFIFVSKCDTTGLVKLEFRVGTVVEIFLQSVVEFDISRYMIRCKKKEKFEKGSIASTGAVTLIRKLQEKLADKNYYKKLRYYNNNNRKSTLENKKNLRLIPTTQNLRLCLFTRSAQEYLFPDSLKNKYKHLINGQALLKWWIPIIDRVTKSWPIQRLIIPGSDKLATKRFIADLPNWTQGHIFSEGLAVYSIPLFPDDPKGRFLEHLIVENRYNRVRTAQFYQELGFRQEFLSNNLVSMIGCSVDNHVVAALDTEKAQDPSVVTVSRYKKIIRSLKGIRFNIKSEVENASTVILQEFLCEI
ncbi:RTT109 [Candida oxycetoniae]|uniref:histone acetyltransferase n=1 Tax=Candida oxycetoniae TaxID=497107 RepID=A0AAI9WXM1_9ASCO|nr:RTT109 [Candida oxycetoniae]KAI3404456.2 RTT109 [Candida oxycetoniae]